MDNLLYSKLPYDLSGSRSKNRFRNELLWGLEELFRLYETGYDFNMIFDYVCDIEVHTNDSSEFYQLKTVSDAKPYTIPKLTKVNKANKSILGKLYILKSTMDDVKSTISSKIAIVSNTPLKGKDDKTYSSNGELELIKLDADSINHIQDHIKLELSINEVSLEDTYYIYTSMDLFSPENSLLGQLINFFINISGKEPKKAKALYQLLADTIYTKSCYELECKSYDELCLKKGISKDSFEAMIKAHIDIANEAVCIAKNYINDLYPSFNQRLKMNNALASIVRSLNLDKSLLLLESSIVGYITNNDDVLEGETVNIVENLYNIFRQEFPIYCTEYEIRSFIILVLSKLQEGSYEAAYYK